jgi:REP-associated tyrosine transposase
MPRKARIDAPGALHHIIARGIDRRSIFKDDTDRDNFLKRVETILSETQTTCYAWALIPNHFHLLLRTGPTSISTVMRRLLTGYAISHNYRHRRHGHLFQNRYKSILCQEDTYLLELIRYIHLNPLRAGIVQDIGKLHRYPYCGHSSLLGRYDRNWQDADYVLKLFHNTVFGARRRYREFVRKGVNQGRQSELTGGGLVRSVGGWSAVNALRQAGFRQKADERILGDGDFVTAVLKQAGEQFERRYELKSKGCNFDTVVERVVQLLGMESHQVLTNSKNRQSVRARSLVCFWAFSELGINQTELAQRFGISQPAVSSAVRKGEKIVRTYSYELLEPYKL